MDVILCLREMPGLKNYTATSSISQMLEMRKMRHQRRVLARFWLVVSISRSGTHVKHSLAQHACLSVYSHVYFLVQGHAVGCRTSCHLTQLSISRCYVSAAQGQNQHQRR